MKKSNSKFIESTFLGVGYTFMILIGYLTYIFMYYILPKITVIEQTKFTSIVFLVMLIIFPTIVYIILINRGFSIIEINEQGVKKSLFRIFYKRMITWDEMKEIRVFQRIEGRVYFGKCKMEKLTYDKLVKNKNIIHVAYSKKVYNAIRLFTKKEIIGINETTVI